MKVDLHVAVSKHAGKVFQVRTPQYTIGRHPDCNLTASSSKISLHHCAILLRGNEAWVRDFDSTNGTFVNDRPVKGERKLSAGDRLRVGPLLLVVALEPGMPKMSSEFSESVVGRMLLNAPAENQSEEILGLDADDFADTVVSQRS